MAGGFGRVIQWSPMVRVWVTLVYFCIGNACRSLVGTRSYSPTRKIFAWTPAPKRLYNRTSPFVLL